MSIRLSRMMELVGQAEREGITLAAMLSRELSPEEMDLAQKELSLHLDNNYAKIENFMSGIRIASIDEVLYPREAVHLQWNRAAISKSSDETQSEQ